MSAAVQSAIAGKIGREHGKSAMRERACEQGPHRMIEACAVQENNGRQRRIEIASAGARECLLAIDNQAHGSSLLRGA
jgi:hypothetical protein